MKEALLVKPNGTYEIVTYQKSPKSHWLYIEGHNPVSMLSEWEMVRPFTHYNELMFVRNILRVDGMCIWKGDCLDQPINKFATALQRVSYLPDNEDIRGNVLITGDHTYPNNTNRNDTNPTIRIPSRSYRGSGTIKTLGRKKIKLLIRRIELSNRLGKSIIPMLEKELE